MPKGRRTLPAAHPLPMAAGVSFDVGKVQTGPGLCRSRGPAASRPAPHGAGGTGCPPSPATPRGEGEAEGSPAFICLRAKSSGTHEVPDSFVITMQKNSFKYRRKQNTRPKAGSASHPSPSLTQTQRRKKTLSKALSGFRNQSRKETEEHSHRSLQK